MIKTIEKIVCDFCGGSGGDASRLTAAKHEWVYFRGKDICPNCYKVLVGDKSKTEIVPERMTDKELADALLEESEWAADNNWDVPIMLPDELKEAARRIKNRTSITWFSVKDNPPKVGEYVIFYDSPSCCMVGYLTDVGTFRVNWDGSTMFHTPEFWTPIPEFLMAENEDIDDGEEV